jgi:hypothetical protein
MDKIKYITIRTDSEKGVQGVDIGFSGYYLGSSDQWNQKNNIINQNDIIDAAKSNILTNITGRTFYRCAKLALPREKMNVINEKYNTKVIRDIKKADHIIISEKYITSLTDSMWEKLYKAEDVLSLIQVHKNVFDNNDYTMLLNDLNEAKHYTHDIYYSISTGYNYYNAKNNVDKLNKAIDKLSGSRGYHAYITAKEKKEWDYFKNNKNKLVLDSLLSSMAVEDSLVINREEFDQLCAMFKGQDSENHVLGMEMIANCNVDESRGFIALLFFRFCEDKFKRAKSWNHVNFKTVRNRFEKFNLTWSRHHTSPYDQFITELVNTENGLTAFVMESILDTVYDEVIEQSFGIKSNSVFEFKRADLKLKKEYADKCIDRNIGEVLKQEAVQKAVLVDSSFDDLPF